ncbi:50S ribosomal protein L15 [Candidatus Shapirobacteria bacterium CG_4_8_14_3_um_filter_35_11]|uniref:Large ribosomal subunit protein uL15 n=6 Tax=Candidatus Shapironibacteriota TaxID=1752721 RepID=A0A1J5HNP3_9BACT|nr:MAG: 50S ribosomal protein L15 [Candidatus Shapirobacteria bacterium CG2_30_35_20]PIV07250.1 MAG: 50S ribosomal protein L15 [Candidatus Shapirobacteria bacterium CG03_land_8_20_14_0_80_35_14]PIX68163.1 MAG: 50S ribosomal protein L15 [Candidatus Shapirobacteria bacterium CG_4_10_14_3_um_filter_35_13]PJA51172.1 MAG: 50S ribosomal protein L15 [Candidatus Shapirobacteria bacterium CG_4_9_14_3_um_filter_36_12]PJC81115.1 MAG: 50S ribosomal protein L15 [Candidatus Shapirobacteria bacterium CG_4_8_1
MDTLNNLIKTTTKAQKRVGRGIGSGVGGHTTGRGAKGRKVRGKVKLTFDGTKIKKGWIKRLPFLRGKHRTNALPKPEIITLAQIEKFYKSGEIVSVQTIFEKFSHLDIRRQKFGVKILSAGELTKKLTFTDVKLSAAARAKIEA